MGVGVGGWNLEPEATSRRARDRFTQVFHIHPHLGPPPSIGGGRLVMLDYFRVRDDKSKVLILSIGVHLELGTLNVKLQ